MSLEEAIEYNKQHMHCSEPEFVVDPDRHKTDQSKWWWVYVAAIDAYGYIAVHCKSDAGMVYLPVSLTVYHDKPTHLALMYCVSSCVTETETL